MKISLYSSLFITLFISGCSALTVVQRNQLAGVAGVVALGHSPTTELVQTYYLGVFDPQDQLPPALYRIRVRGQASALNRTEYASGWVPAQVIDSLTDGVKMSDKDPLKIDPLQGKNQEASSFQVGRRLMLFGPEGFREAPKNHRLAIVMGSSPDVFFDSVNTALGTIAQATMGKTSGSIDSLISGFILRLKTDAELYSAIGGK
jgi:hypothetical protein